MSIEIKFNGGPAGCIKTDVLSDGILTLAWEPYLFFFHLEMYNQFKTGSPTFVDAILNGEAIRLKLIEHQRDFIKVERQ